LATKIGQKNGYAIFNDASADIGTDIINKLTIVPNNEPSSIIELRYSSIDSKFSNNLNYYIEGTFTKSKNYARKINLYLTDDSSSTKYNIATFNIDVDRTPQQYEDEDKTIPVIEKEPFKIAFRPGKSQYSKLVFENIIDNVDTANKQFQLELNTAMELRNILSNEKVVQLGIQADPGFIFLLNGETMKIGRRGFFESPEGYEITDIAVTEPNFIMDYKYEVVEGV
jgi:hypothetical protein